MTLVNVFAFSAVGETAQGNKTCKLIKLLSLVEKLEMLAGLGVDLMIILILLIARGHG